MILVRGIFQRPLRAFAQFGAATHAKVDGGITRDGCNPGAKALGVPEESQAAITLDEGFLGDFLRQITVAQTAPGDSENLFDLAVKCSKTNFIFAHMGALNFRSWNILPLARTAKGFFMDNIYFDVSASIVLMADSPIEDEFIWTIRNVGIDKVFLGSDFPQLTLKQATNALEKLALTEEEKSKIRYENAYSFFR